LNTQLAQNANGSRCGFIALCGRPNVGKSTLFNRLLGHHRSAVSHKAQTTRDNIQGVVSEGDSQIIFIDSPGLNAGTTYSAKRRPWQRTLNRHSKAAMLGVAGVLLLSDSRLWTAADDAVLRIIQSASVPCIAVLNKTDLLKDKSALLAKIDALSTRGFVAIVPLSARKDKNFAKLKTEINALLPHADFIFGGDSEPGLSQNHDHDNERSGDSDCQPKAIVGELLYEQIMRYLHEELPYIVEVTISTLAVHQGRLRVAAALSVPRDNQRAIVIGKQGSRLKMIGSAARKAIEAALGLPTYLKLRVHTPRSSRRKVRAQQPSAVELALLQNQPMSHDG